MTHDERDRPTWDGEAVAEAIGRELARRDDSPLWSDEPFLQWVAGESRDRAARRARVHQDDALSQAGRSLRARVLARRCGVGLVMRPAPAVRPLRHGTPAQVARAAASAGAVACVDLAAAAGAGRALWDEPAESWIALPSGAPTGRSLALRVQGRSMSPLLESGDTILVELGSVLARGRVVVARHPDDGYVCKRVERIGRREVLLASLNPAHPPVTIPRDPRLVVGTVRMAWRARCPDPATTG